jgi:hypothetical protein
MLFHQGALDACGDFVIRTQSLYFTCQKVTRTFHVCGLARDLGWRKSAACSVALFPETPVRRKMLRWFVL